MNGQITMQQAMNSRFYDRNGKIRETPEWVNEKRCGNCIYWQRWSKDEQPPAGWGVKGTCGNYRGPGHYDTAQTSYCQEWHEKPAWEIRE